MMNVDYVVISRSGRTVGTNNAWWSYNHSGKAFTNCIFWSDCSIVKLFFGSCSCGTSIVRWTNIFHDWNKDDDLVTHALEVITYY